MEKKSYNKKVISERKRSDGKTIVNEDAGDNDCHSNLL